MDIKIQATLNMIGNKGIPLAHRSKQLIDILAGAEQENPEFKPIVDEIFKRLQTKEVVSEEIREKAEQLDGILKQIEGAPLRPATFVQMSSLDGSSPPHALVSMDNGELAYVVPWNQNEASKFKLGDRIMLDAHSKIMVHPALNNIYSGYEARLERVIDERHIEVMSHQDERMVVMCPESMVKQIKSGEITPGTPIVIRDGGKLGIKALPIEKSLSHFKYLDRGAIPDIRADRDIGNPPKSIAEIALHIREEMTRPELRRKFRLRPCITRLFAGVSGSGKSLSIGAIHRMMYEIMAEITKTPINELPPRVFRIKSSQMLSMWFGESDKNIDRMFDEVEQLADEKFNGFKLPVMVVLEEADGLGRARGQDNVYDRIMTVILQRLDPNREGLATKLVVFLSTTNEPQIVDPAFLRRIGGTVEVFGRLDQDGFSQILRKHVDGLPVKGAKKDIVNGVSKQMFDLEKNTGVVELMFQGSNEPVIKYRRDFLTGALIDRAVQKASSDAWQQSITNVPDAGLSANLLWNALNHQVLSVVHQLEPANVHQYTDLPDGVRVTRVRRIPQGKEAIYA